MISREELVKFIRAQLNDQTDIDKGTWHYGKMELRQLLDYIYGGDPKTSEQELK